MPSSDSAVSIHPYFQVAEGKLNAFKGICERFVSTTKSESKCLYYGFSFSGNVAHCREAYQDADGLLTHLANVDSILKEALTISELVRLEIHGPTAELEKLQTPLAPLNATYFALEYGFRL